jgi:uncharacterized NAD-dependent epimerase/dehydratase family protein
MTTFPEGRAIVYCEQAFGTTNGKTAHGLVRRTRRYEILSVVDSAYAGRDAGEVLDGRPTGIPIHGSVAEAVESGRGVGKPASHFVIGLAPDGGRLGPEAREAVAEAVRAGLHVDCGLHDFLTEDPVIAPLAAKHGVRLRDVRKPLPRSKLHFFTGKIEQVTSRKLAVLGTDSAVGKRTTAWLLVDALNERGISAELVGTGQTAWMQGVRYGIILDSLINDFVAGEIEHAVWTCWQEAGPDVIVLEGQGSLMNPAYPGGMELLAAGRPDGIVLQHAPARTEYDGFPGYALHPLDVQIRALELMSGKPVVAVTVNHEHLSPEQARAARKEIWGWTSLPTVDPLLDGVDEIASTVRSGLGL